MLYIYLQCSPLCMTSFPIQPGRYLWPIPQSPMFSSRFVPLRLSNAKPPNPHSCIQVLLIDAIPNNYIFDRFLLVCVARVVFAANAVSVRSLQLATSLWLSMPAYALCTRHPPTGIAGRGR